MFCRQCGSALSDSAAFCYRCGAEAHKPVLSPVHASAPEQERARPSRTFTVICILALLAAFGCGMLAGFFVGAAVGKPAAAVTEPAVPYCRLQIDIL